MTAAPEKSRIKPRALRKGDKVGIVAPASNIKRELLEAGATGFATPDMSRFTSIRFWSGICILPARSSAGRGNWKRCSSATMCARSFVRGEDTDRTICCSRSMWPKIAAHPKIFVGYSDVTTLLTWFADKANLVTFHGPMVTKDFAVADGVDLSSWQNALSGQADWLLDETSGAVPLVAGEAEGILYGGCLSMLVAALGTPYEITRPERFCLSKMLPPSHIRSTGC